MATEDRKCENEIKRIIAIARASFENMSKILTSRNLNFKLRLRITNVTSGQPFYMEQKHGLSQRQHQTNLRPLKCGYIEEC